MRYLLILSLFALTTTLSAQLIGETENGLASYYSNEYNGAETAYGVIYDRNELVAAHRLYPQNSVVRVRNVDNGKSVTVRIIDKGPFIRGRIVELSERAAAAIDLLGKETVPVELTLLSTPDQGAVRDQAPPVVRVDELEPAAPIPAEREPIVVEAPVRETPAVTNEAPDRSPEAPQRRATPAPATSPRKATPKPAPAPTVAAREVKAQPVSSRVAGTASFGAGVYKITIAEPAAGAFGVQVGSFSTLESAMDKVTELQGKYFDNILVEVVPSAPQGKGKYKVILGPFETDKSALRYASDLKSRYKIPGFTTRLSGR